MVIEMKIKITFTWWNTIEIMKFNILILKKVATPKQILYWRDVALGKETTQQGTIFIVDAELKKYGHSVLVTREYQALR